MPKLLQNVQGQILDNFEATTIFVTSVEGFYGEDDYVNLGGFEAFLQDFRQAPTVTDLTVPATFGLKTDIPFVTLNISY